MISKPIKYTHQIGEDPYRVEFYFHPLRIYIKLPLKFGMWLWSNWKGGGERNVSNKNPENHSAVIVLILWYSNLVFPTADN